MLDDMMMRPEISQEAGSLSRLLGEAFRSRVEFYEEQFGLSPADARARGTAPITPQDESRILNTPAEQLCWHDIGRLVAKDPQKGLEVWEKTKQHAREELETGHRAASVVDWDSTPWVRARFLVIRDSFIDGWQPRNGVEFALVDCLAQAYTLREFWIERLNTLSTTIGKETPRKIIKSGNWDPPLASANEALDQAAEMVDRFDRLFARNVRCLRDLRRYGPNVMIANAGQVNIGAQQVNAAQVQSRTDDEESE